MKFIHMILIAAALSGCKSAAERAQEAAETRAQVVANAKDVCASFGHAPGTPAFSACVERTFFEAAQAEQQNMNRAVAAYRRPVMCNGVGSTVICN